MSFLVYFFFLFFFSLFDLFRRKRDTQKRQSFFCVVLLPFFWWFFRGVLFCSKGGDIYPSSVHPSARLGEPGTMHGVMTGRGFSFGWFEIPSFFFELMGFVVVIAVLLWIFGYGWGVLNWLACIGWRFLVGLDWVGLGWWCNFLGV